MTRPGAYHLGRILHSAQAAHDDAALQRVAERLDAGMRERLGALLADDGEGTAYARLAADPGRVGLESLLAEIAKLERLRALAIPSDLLRGLHPDQAKHFRRRAAVESAWELRRHPERNRLPLLAFWCVPRAAEVVDGLVELLTLLGKQLMPYARRATAASAWYRKQRLTFSDTLAAVRREIWHEQGFVMSRRAANVRKLRPALRDGITYALCHAA